ncbi:MAG TPA: RsmG family class I SAM-dependent methyltransferase, partial [Cellvibrionaceae bacterium]
KKTRFLFHVKTELGLSNVQLENNRVEAYQPAQKYQAVISRAFASIADMARACRHLLAEDGQFLAMKGVYPQTELEEAAGLCQLMRSIRLQVPEEDGERHLLQLLPV